MNANKGKEFNFTGFLVMLISVVCLLNINCKDTPEYPDEYEPVPPPDPPTITSPLPDTTYNGDIVYVLFDWDSIYQAQCYEICIDTMSTFETNYIIRVENPPVTCKMERSKAVTIYYYRIRAGSRRWIYYTNWSETRRLFVKPEG